MSRPRLLVLGAGRHQAPLIRRAEQRGIETIAVDYYEDSPGKAIASHAVLADALDVAAVTDAAQLHGADGITTIGTDQTVLVLATIAESLGLPCHISPSGALAATNKLHMRRALGGAGVAMTRGVTLLADAEVAEATAALEAPFVVKAADSQGQRGMQRVESREQLAEAIRVARDHSRTQTVVVEEFATGPELTLNVWLRHGRPVLVLPVDRHTYNPSPSIGICLRHVAPSRFSEHADEFDDIAASVAAGFGVTDGPLYIQMLASPEGFRVVEAACRVGGGHEAQLFEEMHGLNLIDLTIDLALDLNDRPLPTIKQDRAGVVNFVAARPGRVSAVQPFAESVDDRQVAFGQWYIAPGYEQAPIVDSMGRIGAFIVSADNRVDALAAADSVYSSLSVIDEDGDNMVVWPPTDQLSADEAS